MYEILFDEYEDEPIARIRLTEGPFCDTIFHVNHVSAERMEEGILSFDYDIDDGIVPSESLEEFEQTIGDILLKIIMEEADKYGSGE